MVFLKYGNILIFLSLLSTIGFSQIIDIKDRVFLGMSEAFSSSPASTITSTRGNVTITSQNGNFVTETGFLDVEVVLTVPPNTYCKCSDFE
jgi:hypothetical protein